MALTDKELALMKYLNKLYVEGADARSKVSKNWDKAIKTIRGETWPERRPKYKINAVMNFLAQIIERKAALLTDSRPTIAVASRKQKDDPVAEILQKTIEAILDEKNFEQKITEFVMLEEYFGFALFNTCWDKNLDYGKGDLDLVVIDPRCFIFDPFVTRSWNLRYAEYCCLETLKPTEMLKDLNPKRADDIRSDFTSEEVKPDSLIHKLRALFGWEKTATEKNSAIPRSIVKDWWVRDRTTRREGKLVFPNWRHIITAGGCPIEDGANPYLDGNHPFDGMEWGFNVDSPYGLNEIDTLESPQILFNKLLAGILENAILMGNAIWVGDQDALSKEDWARLTNEPGSHVKKRPGKDLHREAPPALPGYVMPLATMLINGLEKLSGITEVTEGRRPGQVTSGTAIESLAMMAQTTIRLKARQLEGMTQRIGQKLIPRIFAYYTTDRVFNLVGSKGKIEQYLYERKQIRDVIQKNGMSAFQDYQFKVIPASSLAMTKWQKGLMAVQLFQTGLIDEEAALDALEFPNRDEIMERMAEKQKEMAMMAAQQGGKPPPGFGRKRAGVKMPANLLRGGKRPELGFQEPQMPK